MSSADGTISAALRGRKKARTQLEVVYRDPRELQPDPKNARTHPPDQIEKLRKLIRRFGFTNPILLHEDGATIGAGHGRNEAALAEGLVEVPTIILPGLSDEEWRAYVIADNRVALDGGWNLDLLRAELADLGSAGFDLDLTGFGSLEIKGLLAGGAGRTDPDDAPDPPANPISVLGDMWRLGDHLLICGDCTDAPTVERVLDGAKPHLMVTDPPYGVGYSAGWRNEAMPQKNDSNRWKDGSGSPTGAVLNDDRADWSEAYALFPGDVAYIWHAGVKSDVVSASLQEIGFEIRAQIIWAKQQFPIGRGHYHVQHEPCFYAVRKGTKGHWQGSRKESTLWEIPKPHKSETGHSTQKPVECIRRPIVNNSKPGDAVYEPFSGSGTTIIAAEMIGRAVHAIELSPAYVDVSVKRWEAFTGREAVLEGDGRTFAQVAAERSK